MTGKEARTPEHAAEGAFSDLILLRKGYFFGSDLYLSDQPAEAVTAPPRIGIAGMTEERVEEETQRLVNPIMTYK